MTENVEKKKIITNKKEKKAKKINIGSNELIENNDDFFCYTEFRRKPMPESDIRNISHKLLKWAEREDALTIEKFFDIPGILISESDYYRWVNKYDFFKEAHEKAMRILGTRREEGAISGKYAPVTIMPYLPMYKRKYKENAEWRASLTKKEEPQNQTRIVVIEKFPEVKEVPVKEENGND